MSVRFFIFAVAIQRVTIQVDSDGLVFSYLKSVIRIVCGIIMRKFDWLVAAGIIDFFLEILPQRSDFYLAVLHSNRVTSFDLKIFSGICRTFVLAVIFCECSGSILQVNADLCFFVILINTRIFFRIPSFA